MKIDHVSLTYFRWENIPPTHYTVGSSNMVGSTVLGLLSIRTDDGIEGNAFLGTAMVPATNDGEQLIRWLKPLLMGQDPLERERLHQAMRKRARIASWRVIGAVDVALWDIAGKAAGMPIHRLMGTYRRSVPAYASSQILPDAKAYAEEALSFKARGWRAYKIHPPQTARVDIGVAEAVRAAVGEDYTLMFDAAWCYGYEDALKVGFACQRLGYLWYEDPLTEEEIYRYVDLKKKLDIPIMATEYPAGGLDTYGIWITERATDYLRGDIPQKGGLTTMLKTAHLAEAFGMKYEIHHSGNSLNNVANLHLACAIRNCDWFEVLLPDASHKYGLVEDVTVDAEGLAHAPQKPGLGVEIDRALIKRMTERVLD